MYRIDEIEVFQEGPVKTEPISSFKDAGLHPVMLDNVELSGYENPTPIQKYTIPAILQGHDVIGIAQTGKLLSQSLVESISSLAKDLEKPRLILFPSSVN